MKIRGDNLEKFTCITEFENNLILGVKKVYNTETAKDAVSSFAVSDEEIISCRKRFPGSLL